MANRHLTKLACALVSLLAGACGGGSDSGGESSASTLRASLPTTSTLPLIDGVRTYQVDAGHSEGPVTYPQVPPVGGIHNPRWMPCAYYDSPVPSEQAVHSLEHGAIWITYRPDAAQADVDALAALARSRKDVLVSPWESGLPAPFVATAWGRQLPLESIDDPRLVEFVRLYANQGPEIGAPC